MTNTLSQHHTHCRHLNKHLFIWATVIASVYWVFTLCWILEQDCTVYTRRKTGITQLVSRGCFNFRPGGFNPWTVFCECPHNSCGDISLYLCDNGICKDASESHRNIKLLQKLKVVLCHCSYSLVFGALWTIHISNLRTALHTFIPEPWAQLASCTSPRGTELREGNLGWKPGQSRTRSSCTVLSLCSSRDWAYRNWLKACVHLFTYLVSSRSSKIHYL